MKTFCTIWVWQIDEPIILDVWLIQFFIIVIEINLIVNRIKVFWIIISWILLIKLLDIIIYCILIIFSILRQLADLIEQGIFENLFLKYLIWLALMCIHLILMMLHFNIMIIVLKLLFGTNLRMDICFDVAKNFNGFFLFLYIFSLIINYFHLFGALLIIILA